MYARDILKREAARKRMTMTQIADVARIHEKTVQKFFNGNGDIRFSTLKQIADVLGMKLVITCNQISAEHKK